MGAFRCGCLWAARLLMGLHGRSPASGLCTGKPAADLGAHPPKVSGVGTHSGFQVWAPRPLMEARPTQALWVCVPRQPRADLDAH